MAIDRKEVPLGQSPRTYPSAAGLRTLMQLAPVGIFETDASGRVTYFNPKATQMAGRSVEELLASWEDSLHPEDRQEALASWVQSFESRRPWQREHRIVRPDGGVVWLRFMATPIHDDGEFTGFIATVEDITGRKRFEQSLIDRESYFRLMVNHLPVIVWMGRSDGYCEYLNLRWSETTGQNSQESLGYGWQACIHPEDWPEVRRAHLEASAKRQVIRQECRLRQRSGDYAWVMDIATPRFGEDGQFIGYIGAILDISDRKAAETLMQAAKEAAEQANRAKSLFLAAASHDLRQPLNAISLLIGSLQREITSMRGRTVIDHLETSVRATVELLNALLDLTRLEAGAVEVNRGPVPIPDLFRQIETEHGGQAAAKGLSLRVEPIEETLWTDVGLLRSILRNLVENAIRYTSAGQVQVSCVRRGDILLINVEDTGIGIPVADLDRIFDEFHQLDNPARSRQGGHGLGLAIVRRSANLLGHRLDVSSTPGRGSCFCLEVPLASSHQEKAGENRPENPVAVTACRVLVVEDDPLVQEAMQWALEDMGCDVRITATVAECVTMIESFPPQLIIADYRLPGGGSGLTAIQAVRRQIGPNIPACLITGDVTPSIRLETEKYGVVFLTKPIQVSDLVTVVGRACSSA